MTSVLRYLRLLSLFARLNLALDLTFRVNFLLKVLADTLWLTLLLLFYETIFQNTQTVADWNAGQYLFFVGCYYTLEGLIETLFLGSCLEFAELVRSGNLDIYLLKPVDEQFLITCRRFDWSTAPKILVGCAVMGKVLVDLGWPLNVWQGLAFVLLFVCGVALAYSFLFVLTSTSVWFVHNQSLMEIWWLLMMLMRYPPQVYRGRWTEPIGVVLWYLVPVLLAINVPVSTVVTSFFNPWDVLLLLIVTPLMLLLSRWYCLYALRCYRSAGG